MPIVRFAWSPLLVEVRREACPRARWIAGQRAWMMSDAEAETFVTACHRKLTYERSQAEITVDDAGWVLGFVQGAPFTRSSPGSQGKREGSELGKERHPSFRPGAMV
jgi:hypothetical protein